jgi:hypothetical protein
MKHRNHSTNYVTLAAALLFVTRVVFANPAANHAHTEAGHYLKQPASAQAAYVDSEPPLW